MRVLIILTLLLSLTASGAGADDPSEREDALRTRLLTQLERALDGGRSGDKALTAIETALRVARAEHPVEAIDRVRAALVARVAAVRAGLPAAIEAAVEPTDSRRKALRREWHKRRLRALRFIHSKGRYPPKEKAGARKAQVKVDALVAALRAVWETPLEAQGDRQSSLRTLLTRRDRTAQLLTRWNAEDRSGAALAAVAAKLDKALAFTDLALSPAEQVLIDERDAVLARNRKAELPEATKALLLETNRYRVLFGLPPLAHDARLAKAAAGHSAWMAKTRTMVHNAAGHPEGATPLARAARAGYSGMVGENIASGCRSAAAAMGAWRRSAGHHRNILSPRYRTLGVGGERGYWTQLFGVD